MLLRYAQRDLVLVALLVTIWLLPAAVMLAWVRGLVPSSWLPVFAGVLAVLLVQSGMIRHYHAHTPFFRPQRLNRWFEVVASMSHASANVVYRHDHLFHHQHPIAYTPFTFVSFCVGTARATATHFLDPTKGFRALGILRSLKAAPFAAVRSDYRSFDDYADAPRPTFVKRVGASSEARRRLRAELLAIFAWRVVLLALSPKVMFAVVLPAELLASWLSQSIEYAEHYGSAIGDRGRDAASCYAPLYNWFWLNNGYHQEHHLRPGVHWAKIPLLRGRLPPESTRATYDALGIFPRVRRR